MGSPLTDAADKPLLSESDVRQCLPNFFIVGAPKSGTTALYEYLRQHPEIFMPEDLKRAGDPVGIGYKEPHFFAPDLDSPSYVRDPDLYRWLFRDAASFPRRGEASVYYLYSKAAAQNIYSYNPDARIIIMLRNPVDVAYALHSEHRWSLKEPCADFGEALEQEVLRAQAKQGPAPGHGVHLWTYRPIGHFDEQVQRYLDVFPREQIKIILYDELRRDALAIVRSVHEFLGVEHRPPTELQVVHANRDVRFPLLHRLTFSRPPLLRPLLRSVLPQDLRHAIAWRLFQISAPTRPRKPMDNDLRRKLTEYYCVRIRRLEKMISRDLSAWL